MRKEEAGNGMAGEWRQRKGEGEGRGGVGMKVACWKGECRERMGGEWEWEDVGIGGRQGSGGGDDSKNGVRGGGVGGGAMGRGELHGRANAEGGGGGVEGESDCEERKKVRWIERRGVMRRGVER